MAVQAGQSLSTLKPTKIVEQLSLLDKYNIIQEFFGLSAISIKNISGTKRERDLKTQEILEGYHILEPTNFKRLKSIISTLEKPASKRTEKEIHEIVPLLSKLDFFEKRFQLTHRELDLVSAQIRYEYKEPGETVFKVGDQASSFYIMVKGRVQVSIPSYLHKDFKIPSLKKLEKVEIKF